MAAIKANIYEEKDVICNQDLLEQLKNAVEILEERMKATVPISKGTCKVGFGVSKTQRGIAADQVISIAKAIKSLKGW